MRWGSPPRDGAAGAGAPGGVSVLGQETLGGYEVARLAADDASALQAWLDANGYSVPPAAQPILTAYMADGWSFVAVRLAAGAPDGSLEPSQLTSDFAVGRAASDEPYREEVVVYDDVYLLNRDVGFILAITCLMAVTPLSLVIAVFIRGRMAAIAPKREEPDG